MTEAKQVSGPWDVASVGGFYFAVRVPPPQPSIGSTNCVGTRKEAQDQADQLNAQERTREAAEDLLASLSEFVALFTADIEVLNDKEKEILHRAQANIRKATGET